MSDAPANPPLSRTGRRIVAAFLGTSLLSLALNGIGQMNAGGESASVLESIPPLLVVVVTPTLLAAALLWYAVAGWKRSPEPRWMRAIRWGSIGGVVWATVGTIGLALYYYAVQGRDAGLTPILAFLSSPIGFAIGAIAGWRARG
jgi:hypothetical protein